MSFKWWLLSALSIFAFLINVDYTAVNLILIPISDEFSATLTTTKWLLTAYVLFWGLFILPSGRMADKFGHQTLAISGLCIFALSSLVAMFAGSIATLIVARALQGIGGALFLPCIYVLISKIFPSNQQSLAIGILSVGIGFGAAIGPILGGTLLTYFGWRSIFFINIPICLFAIAILLKNKKTKVDMPALQPLYTSMKHLFNNRSYLCCVICIGIEQYWFACVIVATGLYLLNSLQYTSMQASIMFLPMTLVFGIISVISGRWNDKHGIKKSIIIGLGLISLASFGFAKLSEHSSIALIISVLTIAGLGMGLAFAALNSGVVKMLDQSLVGMGSSVFSVFGLAGNFIGATVTVYMYELGASNQAMIFNAVLLLGTIGYVFVTLRSNRQLTVNQEVVQ